MSENSSADTGAVRSSTVAATEIQNDERRAVYEYVAEHGPVRPDRLQEELFPNDRRAACHHLALLKRDGFLVEEDDRVRVAVDRLAEPETVDIPDLSSPVEFRPATESDRADLVDVVDSVSGERVHVDAATLAATLRADGSLHRGDSGGERVFYVATVEDAVCGWVHLEASSPSRLRHTATLTGGVAEDRRNAGIGTRLLEYAQERADRCGYQKLYQHLPATNQTGIDFLADRSWTVEATHEDHYRTEDSYVDEVILSYAVDG
jgi:GNAT superfamily N-acetyltransferase